MGILRDDGTVEIRGRKPIKKAKPVVLAARKRWEHLVDDEDEQRLVIDDNANIRLADGGHWVAAWLWLPENED